MAHWYDHQGYLYGSVPLSSKDGLRDFDLRDARKVHALASVTNVLGLLSKPGLVRWQVEQGIKAAIENPAGDVPGLYQKSQEYTRYTQDFGTATHWWLNKKLRAAETTTEIPPMIPGAEEVADGILSFLDANGYVITHTEHRVARPDLGTAGTIDLDGTHYGKPFIGDAKTQESPLTPYAPE